jgi:hypothetical protein
VLAASLTELWSRLLQPSDAPTSRAAVTEAAPLRRRLLEPARMHSFSRYVAWGGRLASCQGYARP